MVKIIVADSNIQSRELLVHNLKSIENVDVKDVFDNIFSIDYDLKNIDLIIFDINSKEEENILDQIKVLKNKFSNLNFIAISYEINSELVVKTLKTGVREFLLKPVISNILEASIKKIADLKNNVNNNFNKTISIFSNKGGVGKTSLAVNLAYELSNLEENNNVCLLDLSFNTEDVSTFLDITPKYKADYVLNHIETSDSNMLLSLMNRYKTSNLYILSLQENMKLNIKFTPKLVNKVINSLKNVFSKIIIDTSSSINETSTSIINNSDLVLMVGLMNLSSVKGCQKCYEFFNNMNFNSNKIKLIMNRFIQNPDFTLDDVQKTIGREVFAKIPNNYLTLIDAINSASTVLEANPQSNIAKAYKILAQQIEDLDFEALNNYTSYNHGIFNLLRKIGE